MSTRRKRPRPAPPRPRQPVGSPADRPSPAFREPRAGSWWPLAAAVGLTLTFVLSLTAVNLLSEDRPTPAAPSRPATPTATTTP